MAGQPSAPPRVAEGDPTLDRVGQVWELSWPGGQAILLLLGEVERRVGSKRMTRALTLSSEDEATPAGEVDWWVVKWFDEEQEPGLSARRLG